MGEPVLCMDCGAPGSQPGFWHDCGAKPRTHRVLEERKTGARLSGGTEFVIVDQLVRDQRPGSRPTWLVVLGLCNGVPFSSREFKTLRAAREDFGRSSRHAR